MCVYVGVGRGVERGRAMVPPLGWYSYNCTHTPHTDTQIQADREEWEREKKRERHTHTSV